MKNLGKLMLAYFLVYLGLFSVSAQAFGLKSSLLTFAVVHVVAFGLILTWLWLEDSRLSKGSGKFESISFLHARGKSFLN